MVSINGYIKRQKDSFYRILAPAVSALIKQNKKTNIDLNSNNLIHNKRYKLKTKIVLKLGNK